MSGNKNRTSSEYGVDGPLYQDSDSVITFEDVCAENKTLRDELEAARNVHAWLAGIVPDVEPYFEKLADIVEEHYDTQGEELDVGVFLSDEFAPIRRVYNRNALIASLTQGPVGLTGPMGMSCDCRVHGVDTV